MLPVVVPDLDGVSLATPSITEKSVHCPPVRNRALVGTVRTPSPRQTVIRQSTRKLSPRVGRCLGASTRSMIAFTSVVPVLPTAKQSSATPKHAACTRSSPVVAVSSATL